MTKSNGLPSATTLMHLKNAIPDLNLNWLLFDEPFQYTNKDRLEQEYLLLKEKVARYEEVIKNLLSIMRDYEDLA